MQVAADADIFVKSLNDNVHKNKAKELEVYMYVEHARNESLLDQAVARCYVPWGVPVSALLCTRLTDSCLRPAADSIASSLLLGVSAAGFFGTTSLKEGPFMQMAIVSFCISTFAYMSTAIMSAIFLLP